MIHFTINLTPKAQKRARSRAIISRGKAIAMIYKDPSQRQEEEDLIALMVCHRPPAPLEGPLSLQITAYLPIPASKAQKWKNAALAGEIRPITKPDNTNLAKNLEDCMTMAGFWIDDRQIVTLTIEKFYGEPRWEIILKSA